MIAYFTAGSATLKTAPARAPEVKSVSPSKIRFGKMSSFSIVAVITFAIKKGNGHKIIRSYMILYADIDAE